MEFNPFKKRPLEDHEAGVDEDMTIVKRLGLDGMKGQLDRHSQLLSERVELLTDSGISLVEAAAGVVAVTGAAGTVLAFRLARN